TPANLFGDHRKNSMGINLANDNDLRQLAEQMNSAVKPWSAAPLVPDYRSNQTALPVTNPADRRQQIGVWTPADAQGVATALDNAAAAQAAWDATPAAARAKIIEHAADLLETRRAEFMALAV